MAAREHLLKVAEIRHHRHHVVLDVGQIEANVTAGCDRVLLVASFSEPFDDVRFAAEEAEEGHHLLTRVADGSKDDARVFHSRSEDVVFDRVSLVLGFTDNRAECIDNVITILINQSCAKKKPFAIKVLG